MFGSGRCWFVGAVCCGVLGCGYVSEAAVDEPSPAASVSKPGSPLCTRDPQASKLETDDSLPKHLRRWPGLFVRTDDAIVDARPADVAVARRYPYAHDKGKSDDGQRISIMTRCERYRVGEPVRVIHVYEAMGAGLDVYVMGPKPVRDEWVDGVEQPSAAGLALYDGAFLPGPAVDYNYSISEYRFDTPGVHEVTWRGGGDPIQGDLGLESNTLRLEIVP